MLEKGEKKESKVWEKTSVAPHAVW